MKKVILATSIMTILSLSNPAQATNEPVPIKQEQSTQKDLIGFGSGALAGAAVGGPLGAVIGGIFGLLIADDIQDEALKEQQSIALQHADGEIQEQAQLIAALEKDMRKMHEQQMISLVNFEQSQQQLLNEKLGQLEVNVQFKTASADIDESYQAQLSSIANLVKQFPELSLLIEGYADQRGDSKYNQALSTTRAQAVANYLMAMDVKQNNIQVIGNGVADTHDLTTSSKETLFFDRRVNIRILPQGQIMTAAN